MANLLIVDDELSMRQFLTHLFQRDGHAVRVAENGRKAMDLLRQQPADVIISDVKMPDMGGVETARRIKANPETARLPVIAMSADTIDGEASRLREIGMDDYIAKPVEPATLKNVVERWLPQRHQAIRLRS